MKRTFLLGGAVALVLGLAAYAAEVGPVAGYLKPEAVPDVTAVVTPPPADGSWSESRDRSVFFSTRALQGTPRWEMAARDNVQNAQSLSEDFACALGVELDPAKAPRLRRLLERTLADSAAANNKAKDAIQKKRPYLLYGGPTCVPGPTTYSYPSGHTTVSWAYGLILTELFPDKGSAIMSRARAYGESRVVCGVHTPSDLEAGRMNGAIVAAALHANPEFQADFAAARTEVAALRKASAPLSAERAKYCAIEAEASANRPW